jgi:hypothetical protein
MGDHERLIEISEALAAAIARRDVAAIRPMLARGFVHRTPGGPPVEIDAFLGGVTQIPGEILSVAVERLTTDLSGDGAVVTGRQRAQLKIDGELVDDERPFVDWFVREDGEWRLRAAIDLDES